MISKGQTETNRYRFLARTGGFVWVVTQATVVFDKQKPQSVVCVNYVIRWVFFLLLTAKHVCQTKISLHKWLWRTSVGTSFFNQSQASESLIPGSLRVIFYVCNDQKKKLMFLLIESVFFPLVSTRRDTFPPQRIRNMSRRCSIRRSLLIVGNKRILLLSAFRREWVSDLWTRYF